jgi:hypothetical protein
MRFLTVMRDFRSGNDGSPSLFMSQRREAPFQAAVHPHGTTIIA